VEFIEGFWLPQDVRDQLLAPGTEYRTLSFVQGRPCEPGDESAVTIRWPFFDQGAWEQLLVALRSNRQRVPQGQAFWDRFQAALEPVARRFADPADPLHNVARAALPVYTGYSEAMVRMTLGALDMWALEQFPAAFQLAPTLEAAANWQAMGNLAGRLRFYEDRRWHPSLAQLLGRGSTPLFGPRTFPDLVVGYGAGNVPGTALLIAFLAHATTLAGGPSPVVAVKNSRREPIFTPLVLTALESVDPDLVAATAVLIWDYEDASIQKQLLGQADLVIAAASDATIDQIGKTLDRAGAGRFHAHGHKVSFSAIGRQVLAHGLCIPEDETPLVDVVTLLAALDSVFWDQHGCLSSRIHFVEAGGRGYYGPLEYAARLVEQLGVLASFLPRGAWPRRRLHDRFDRYKSLEKTGQVQVLSRYDDEFVVVVDARPLDAARFRATVNDCEGRVIVVRPVQELMEIPDHYLRLLPVANLQSLSVALGRQGEGLTEAFLHFAGACGARGVTAIRTVGRGAFPQLAYSWDGLIPLDLIRPRREGRFATIEFDAPYEEMLATYRLMLQRVA
jgi:hypothetical protein